MKCKKIKCHQSVTLNAKENLGFSRGIMPGFPKGIDIELDLTVNAFKITHGDDVVYVSKENVPFFELEPVSNAQTTPVTKRKKTADELVDSVF